MNLRIASHLLTCGVVAAASGLAQAPPAFEVASIKPNHSAARNSGFRRASPGSLNATNVTLKMLISYAYDVRDYQISGGAGWIDAERYDILAKPEPGEGTHPATEMERNAMLRRRVQTLLADRFQLVLRRSTKELPTFTLFLAKNGPKGLTAGTGEKSELVDNGHHLTCREITMASFCKIFLQSYLRRWVVDKTGITGAFDFSLDWVPEEGQRRLPEGEPAAAAPASPDGPSFFTALQEQLGLKLEPGKGPVEVLMIESAEKPSEN